MFSANITNRDPAEILLKNTADREFPHFLKRGNRQITSKKFTFHDDFGGSYTFHDSESQHSLFMIPPYRDVPAARKHKGSVGTSWMYEIDVLRAKDESVDLLSCCWLIPEKSA